MALGKADFTRSEGSSTPRVTQAYQGEPELRRVTPAFRSLSHPRAGAGPKGFPVSLSAFLPIPPGACSPLEGLDLRSGHPPACRQTLTPPDLRLLKLSPVTDLFEQQETGLCSSTDTHGGDDPFDGGCGKLLALGLLHQRHAHVLEGEEHPLQQRLTGIGPVLREL